MPNSRKHDVPEMVQHSKDAVKNERVHGPHKGEHKMIQQNMLLLLRMLLKKMVQIKELKKWKRMLKKQKFLPV